MSAPRRAAEFSNAAYPQRDQMRPMQHFSRDAPAGEQLFYGNPHHDGRNFSAGLPHLPPEKMRVNAVSPAAASTIVDTASSNGDVILIQPARDTYHNRISCVKFVIFGSNVVFALIGVCLLALGAFLKADDRFRDLLSENFRQATSKAIDPTLYVGTYMIIGIGVAMVIISFFGCCGAIREHRCMLTTYFVGVIALFFLHISMIVLVFSNRDKMENDVGDTLDYMVEHYYRSGIVQDVMDQLQTTFRCCGNSGCADYAFLRQNVPRSCDTACDGCRYRMFRVFRDGFTVIGIAMIFVLIAEILAVAFSLYLCCFVQKHKPRTRYVYYKAAPVSTSADGLVPNKPVKKPL